MAEYSEKHFCIDAGEGEKMDGCPYSLYEDGHDVQDYIIAPKGYKFIGFKCIMLPENRIYDGKLIAQYEKEPFSNRIQSNLKYIIIGVAALVIIGIVIALVSKPSDGRRQNSLSASAPTRWNFVRTAWRRACTENLKAKKGQKN